MQQNVCKTQLLIYRQSFRKHRERLADIKHNSVYGEQKGMIRQRPQDKKKFTRQKIKKQEIQLQNGILQGKIDRIKVRISATQGGQKGQGSTEKMRNRNRYESEEEGKLEVKSDYDDEEVKCVLPGAHRQRALSFIPKDGKINTKARGRFIQSMVRPAIGSIIRQDRAETAAQEREYFHDPQRNEGRRVIFKKTNLLSNMCSCLYELSLIGGRLLAVAYVMGVENYSVKLLFDEKKTLELLREYEGNYDAFCGRLVVERRDNGCHFLRLLTGIDKEKPFKEQSEQQKGKKKIKVQAQFLKRNYYTLIKSEEANQTIKENNKEITKPVVLTEHLRAVVDRLAAPKRYQLLTSSREKQHSHPSEQDSRKKSERIQGQVFSTQGMKNRQIGEAQKISKRADIAQPKKFIPVKRIEQDKRQTSQQVKQIAKKQQTENVIMKKQQRKRTEQIKINDQRIQTQVKQKQAYLGISHSTNKQLNEQYHQYHQQGEQSDVEYIGEYEEEFEGDFENPVSPRTKKSELKQIDKNQFQQSDKFSDLKMKQSVEYSRKQGQKAYEQSFQQDFQGSNEISTVLKNKSQIKYPSSSKAQSITKNQLITKNQSLVSQQVEQEYEQQFQN